MSCRIGRLIMTVIAQHIHNRVYDTLSYKTKAAIVHFLFARNTNRDHEIWSSADHMTSNMEHMDIFYEFSTK